jgi:putative tryptophan/tyrosine transport system substrate-binding protein
VAQGLVASLSRPGGNATGVAVFTNELGPKRLGLLRELVPKAGLIAFIANLHSTTMAAQVKDVQTAAEAFGQKLLVVNASTPEEIEQAFATIAQEKAGAVLYSAHQFYQIVRDQLVALAARHRLPALYEWREFVEAGGLASYSTSRNDSFRQMGVYTGQILKGAKPSELPVVQPTKFELVIIASGKSRKGGRDVATRKPFIAVQRVRLPPGKGEPASRKRALRGWWQHHSRSVGSRRLSPAVAPI